MDQQELMYKFSFYEQQIKNLQEQLQAVDQAIVDSSSLEIGLDELKGAKDKEVMAQIGRGIYARTRLISEDLLVDVGDKNFVKKSVEGTQKTIKEQIEKLREVKKQIENGLEEINEELTKIFLETQKKAKED